MFPHKQLILTCAFAGASLALHGQMWIGQARTQGEGAVVEVKGIALNGPELGLIRYIQDETGAIALYPGSGSVPGLEDVQAGDEVLATGVLDPYQGLLEISPIFQLEILSSGNPLPEPQVILPGDFSEMWESEHVRLQCVSFGESGFFEENETYLLTHYGGIGFNLYVPDGSPLAGEPIPDYPVELTGILSQSNTYQMVARGMEDLPQSPCLFFTTEVLPLSMETEALDLFWKTNEPCACAVRYGETAEMASIQENAALLPVHTFSLENLKPATAYYVQAICEKGGVEVRSPVRIFSTVSTSSGAIDVYFNQPTDPVFSSGSLPSGDSYQELEAAMIARIDAAEETIDVAVYNANLTQWIDALVAAHGRGVQVRYIFEDESTNSALSGSLPFPILEGNPGALMHHKFLVIDADIPEKAYVVTGSMNWTNSGWKNDYNNQLIIQDQALARAYRTEFVEMWGGRFGPAKVDNTPSLFRIGGRLVELFFTPSDKIVSALSSRIGTAEADLAFGLFILTRDELAAAVKDAWFGGKDVRVIIEDADISGSDYNFLKSQGVPVQEHEEFGLFHHKYAIIDAAAPDSAPMVITGSYNWTAAATEVNDENLLIIHDAAIANQFLQEFEARWQELTPVGETSWSESRLAVFPNPSDGKISIQWEGPEARIQLWNGVGRLIGELPSGLPEGLSPGLYVVTAQLPDGEVLALKVVVQ
jgi:phosphatidylserine/phosphatidylglycerophosphate/cardiolipin synthase-like enzyme